MMTAVPDPFNLYDWIAKHREVDECIDESSFNCAADECIDEFGRPRGGGIHSAIHWLII